MFVQEWLDLEIRITHFDAQSFRFAAHSDGTAIAARWIAALLHFFLNVLAGLWTATFTRIIKDAPRTPRGSGIRIDHFTVDQILIVVAGLLSYLIVQLILKDFDNLAGN